MGIGQNTGCHRICESIISSFSNKIKNRRRIASGNQEEYDALPNGHSCGHNLIAAWAYGTALVLKDLMKDGKIVLFGTPSESCFMSGALAGAMTLISSPGFNLGGLIFSHWAY